MEKTTDYATVSRISQRDPRSQAVELYRTTELSVAEIATQTGVSRESVYRWLRHEGITVGRLASNIAAGKAGEQMLSFGEEVKELRREITALMGQVRRLEGLIEALVALKAQAV
jgi:transposase-like protein